MAIEDHSSVRALVRRTLDAPADALEAVPTLVAALDAEDPAVRAGVGWALCSVAAANPDDAPEIVHRLDGRHGHTAPTAAGWIRRELDLDGVATGASHDRPARSPDEQEASSDDAQSGGAPTRPDGPDPGHRPDGESSEETTTVDSTSEHNEVTTPSRESDERVPERPDRVVENGQFTIPLDRTPLDSLEIVERLASDRHSWTYVGMGMVDAQRHAVLVRTYRPPQGGRLSTFAGAFEEVTAAWGGVDDHENVLTLYAFGRRPHPWVVTGYAPETLSSVGRLPVEAALEVGLDAATGLGHAHERGVTHRSLDPRSVALDSEYGRAVGRLANFGIVEPYRAVDGPLPLDSRYGAPELFDAEHGAVDWLTDVYHLGAVLYTSLTGRPPYDASLVERGGPAGLSYEPPSSVVEAVPVAADRIVAKAMATHKIARYESADEMARDLKSALAAVTDEPR